MARKRSSEERSKARASKEAFADTRGTDNKDNPSFKSTRRRVEITIGSNAATVAKEIAKELARNGGERSPSIKSSAKLGEIGTGPLGLRRAPQVGAGHVCRVIDLRAVINGLLLRAAASLEVSVLEARKTLQLGKGKLAVELHVALEVMSAVGTDLLGIDEVSEPKELNEAVGLGGQEAWKGKKASHNPQGDQPSGLFNVKQTLR